MSNTDKLHETLEKQRGVFCQISMLYFTAVMIGLGLLSSQQTTLGLFVLTIVDIMFLVAITGFFAILAYHLQGPVKKIDEQLSDIVNEFRSHLEEGGT